MIEPQIGQYGLVHTGTFSGFFIGLGTNCDIDHVVIYMGNDQIMEATPRKGIAFADVNKYKNIAWNSHEPMTQEQGLAVAEAAKTFIGQKYLFRAIFAIACKILHIKLPKRFYGDLEKAHGAICSEFLVKSRRKSGFPIEGDKPDYLISPANLTYRLLYI